MQFNILKPHTRGGAGPTVPARIVWLLGHTRRKSIWVTTLLPPARKQKQNADYSGETWVAEKAEPISRYSRGTYVRGP